MNQRSMLSSSLTALVLLAASPAFAAELVLPEDPMETVGKADDAWQAAEKSGNAARMEALLAEGFEWLQADGRSRSRDELLAQAREREPSYESHRQSDRTVRLLGAETATVSARLHLKGRRDDKAFEHSVWLTDVYVRQAEGWRLMLRQTAQPMSPHD